MEAIIRDYSGSAPDGLQFEQYFWVGKHEECSQGEHVCCSVSIDVSRQELSSAD